MRYGTLILLFISITSCIKQKHTLYLLPNTDSKYAKYQLDSVPEYKIQPSDILAIEVNSTVATTTDLIENKFKVGKNEKADQFNGYLVDNQGLINMPLIGKIKVDNLTCNQASDTIQKNFNQYLQFVTVSVKLGFKFNVLGEVLRPGQIETKSNKINIFEALALAGDITEFGNRQMVKIVRTKENQAEVFVVDVSKRDIISSKFYYIQNNDTIIVDRRKSKTDKSNVTNISLGLSILSILIILFINTRNFR